MKKETIYNYRIKEENDIFYPQFNHKIHGWVNIRTYNIDDKDNVDTVFLDISGGNEEYVIKNKNHAMLVIKRFKEVSNNDIIKTTYYLLDEDDIL